MRMDPLCRPDSRFRMTRGVRLDLNPRPNVWRTLGSRGRLKECPDRRNDVVVVVDDGYDLPFIERQAGVGNAESDHVADAERRAIGHVHIEMLVVHLDAGTALDEVLGTGLPAGRYHESGLGNPASWLLSRLPNVRMTRPGSGRD